LDYDEPGALAFTIAGAGFVLIALFLPLFTVHYSPPGGSAVLYGHRVATFVDNITGWQFAHAARWTHLLYVMGFLCPPIIGVILQSAGAAEVRFFVTDGVQLSSTSW
jgi:hypothetical protein